ncbi:MAG: class I SAM-dependent methyltransferase [Candidatus Pacebacteria bacterium]|nr:class I SAM-dependent methyltransferase [Candidatus Paceibacterota bacterium]
MQKKIGGYGFSEKEPEYISEYSDGNPEEIFKRKLIELSSKNKNMLDVGCGDGIFAFQMANYFSNVVGIDFSIELLKIANEKQKELNIENCRFEVQNAEKTSFDNSSFNVIFSRRGLTPYHEFYRLLKTEGSFVIITIGETDAKSLKEVFGRGQNYNERGDSRLKTDTELIKKIGFEIAFAEDYFYEEYYPSYDEFNLFLQGVPIFEDFDPSKDRKFVEEYINLNATEKGD